MTNCLLTIKKPALVAFSQPPGYAPLTSYCTLHAIINLVYFRSYYFFLKKFPDIPSISAQDIFEVHSGLTTEAESVFPNIDEKAKAQGFFVTILFNPSMVLAIECANLDDRNFLVNGLRSLIAEVQLDLSIIKTPVSTPIKTPLAAADEPLPAGMSEKYAKLLEQVRI